jgi:zinc transport system ATP-binding protein
MTILSAEDVSFAYGDEVILDGVTLTLDAGEFVALAGPNGSGKSTLLRVLLGLLRPTAGRVRVFGEDPRQLGDRWRLGYVPQRPSLAREVPASVEEVVAAGRLARTGWRGRMGAADRIAIDHALEAVSLLDLRHRPVTELSGGQQQRSFIAKALASEPELLILDEPVAGVDAESQKRFSDSLTHLVDEHGAGVLLVSHELNAVAHALDRVIVLKKKIHFDGPPSELAGTGVRLGADRADLPMWLEGLG